MLRIVPHTVPRVGRSYEHFPDGFELHLLQCNPPVDRTEARLVHSTADTLHLPPTPARLPHGGEKLVYQLANTTTSHHRGKSNDTSEH